MVDAGAEEGHFSVRHIDPFGDHLAGSLHTMTESNVRAASGGVDRPAVCRHRVDVVQEQGVRGKLIEFKAKLDEDRDRAERSKYPTGTKRIADALFHAVSPRYFDVKLVRLQSALLKCRDHIIRIPESAFAIHGRLNFHREFSLFDDRLDDPAALFKALRIDIHQADGAVLQARRQQDIVAEISGKYEASSTN